MLHKYLINAVQPWRYLKLPGNKQTRSDIPRVRDIHPGRAKKKSEVQLTHWDWNEMWFVWVSEKEKLLSRQGNVLSPDDRTVFFFRALPRPAEMASGSR